MKRATLKRAFTLNLPGPLYNKLLTEARKDGLNMTKVILIALYKHFGITKQV